MVIRKNAGQISHSGDFFDFYFSSRVRVGNGGGGQGGRDDEGVFRPCHAAPGISLLLTEGARAGVGVRIQ